MKTFYDMPLEVIKKADEAMDDFNWHRVYLVMDFLNWQWVGKGVPEIPDMKEFVRSLIKDSYYNSLKYEKTMTTSSGGFEVICFYKELDFEIRFILSRSLTL